MILTASYLWKDTWKRWLEQPGSVLARSVVTIIMVALSVLLLVGFRMQIDKLRTEVDKIGLDNILVNETVTSQDVLQGIPSDRFRSLQKWGKLFTVKAMPLSARGSDGENAKVYCYTDDDFPGLLPYLKHKQDVFVITQNHPEGLIIDYDINGQTFTAITIHPEEKITQLIQGNSLFIPSSYLPEIHLRGFSMIYYLEREAHSPSIASLTEGIQAVVRADGNSKVDVTTAAPIKEKLDRLEQQQSSMRIWLAAIMGGAVALIYGVLSILEFRQSMYISALLKSFGVPKLMLGIRSVVENLLIVNIVTIGIIYALSKYHSVIFKALRVSGEPDIDALYWGQETIWIIAAANVGVIISSIPVFLALRKQIGNILE